MPRVFLTAYPGSVTTNYMTFLKSAVCNELFGTLEFSRSLDLLAQYGFTGVEIAPYTLFGDFSSSSVEKGLKEVRRALSSSGLSFAGLHWLFVKPEGLHVTSREPGLRKKSWDHLKLLLDISGELGGGALVFGSPKQRASRGIPIKEAMMYYLDGLTEAASYAEERNSAILVEALASKDTDIVNTLADASDVVRRISKPGVQTMFDFHNTVDEVDSWDVLIDRHWDSIRHVHINEMDGSWPNRESGHFAPAFKVLGKRNFQGWVSLEIFSVPEDPEKVLKETREFFNAMEAVIE